MYFRLYRMLLTAAGGEGNGNNEPPPKEPEKAPDLAKAVEGLLTKHGDAGGALRVLLSENYQLRDSNRELKTKLPADGTRVLTADEAKLLDSYSALGKPEDLKKIKTEHGTLSSEVTGLKRDTELRTVAEKAGVKFGVLKTLAGSLDFSGTVRVKDAKTGKETEVLAVKDGDAEPVAFDAYAAKHWDDFLPALRAGETAKAPSLTTPPRRPATPPPPAKGAADPPENTGLKRVRI